LRKHADKNFIKRGAAKKDKEIEKQGINPKIFEAEKIE
jgi:hypothetical protein